MPAEWESHEGTWIAWPHNKEHWPGKFEPIPPLYGELTRALHDGGDKVFILVKNADMEHEAREQIKRDTDDIRFFHFQTNSSWTRDFGPIFVYDDAGDLTITDWKFNMWGGKYPPWDRDDVIPQKIGAALSLPVLEPPMILEGGSIDVNGNGVLLTTRQCLLNKNRNPGLSQVEIEKFLDEYLGAKKILWLEEGIVGDDTDGHIDDIARFVDAKTILAQVEKNPEDENHEILQKNLRELHVATDVSGNPFRVIPFPMPSPVIYEGQRLPASYANFYIANKAVLVPTFQCAQDAQALALLQDLFPTRKIIGIDAVDFIWGLGTIHCSTQQYPKIRA